MSGIPQQIAAVEAKLEARELEAARTLAEALRREHPRDLDGLRVLVKVLHRQGLPEEATARLKVAHLIEVESHTFFDDLGPEAVVLDLGGWEGNFTAEMVRRYGCAVHVIEPNPKYHERLTQRFREEPRVRVYHGAVGGETGTATFYPSPPDFPGREKGSSLLAASPYVDAGRSCEVPVETLAGFVARTGVERIDLLKMDVEGAEMAIFRDPATRAVLDRCRSLTVEFHHWMPVQDTPFFPREEVEAVIETIAAAGFRWVDFGRDYAFIDALFYRE